MSDRHAPATATVVSTPVVRTRSAAAVHEHPNAGERALMQTARDAGAPVLQLRLLESAPATAFVAQQSLSTTDGETHYEAVSRDADDVVEVREIGADGRRRFGSLRQGARVVPATAAAWGTRDDAAGTPDLWVATGADLHRWAFARDAHLLVAAGARSTFTLAKHGDVLQVATDAANRRVFALCERALVVLPLDVLETRELTLRCGPGARMVAVPRRAGETAVGVLVVAPQWQKPDRVTLIDVEDAARAPAVIRDLNVGGVHPVSLAVATVRGARLLVVGGRGGTAVVPLADARHPSPPLVQEDPIGRPAERARKAYNVNTVAPVPGTDYCLVARTNSHGRATLRVARLTAGEKSTELRAVEIEPPPSLGLVGAWVRDLVVLPRRAADADEAGVVLSTFDVRAASPDAALPLARLTVARPAAHGRSSASGSWGAPAPSASSSSSAAAAATSAASPSVASSASFRPRLMRLYLNAWWSRITRFPSSSWRSWRKSRSVNASSGGTRLGSRPDVKRDFASNAADFAESWNAE
jgi:hypothetical protein